jgi:hypothetical protein
VRRSARSPGRYTLLTTIKCKPEDTACQMAVAMKLMAAQGGGAGSTAPRYQAWTAAPKGSRLEVTADYQEQWDGVFLTGARETRHCKAVFKGSTTNPATSAKDRESRRDGTGDLARRARLPDEDRFPDDGGLDVGHHAAESEDPVGDGAALNATLSTPRAATTT